MSKGEDVRKGYHCAWQIHFASEDVAGRDSTDNQEYNWEGSI